MNPSSAIITVSQFLDILNETLGAAFPEVVIEGEVSSFKVNQGKFVFFDLKDAAGSIGCFMMLFALKTPLEDGMKVRVTATPKLTKWGKFSLTVRAIELAGEGALRRSMELLRRKLDAEGLFDPARKRPLPAFPTRIGLVTSATSAAYADFVTILGDRWGGLTIELADVTVQGATAPAQIVAALTDFNVAPRPVDVLVLIRGGGSLEDLQAFSTEDVARAVAASRIPIVVGVGHEVDTSLADFAADVRAATPTDAARIVVPDRHALADRLQSRQLALLQGMAALLRQAETRTDRALVQLERGLRAPREKVLHQERMLLTGFQTLLTERRTRILGLARALAGYDPKAVLRRGYALVRHEGRVVRSADQLSAGDTVVLELGQGTRNAEIRDHD